MTVSARLAAQRAAQGLPPTIEDPVALAAIAAIVVGDGEGAAGATPRTTFPVLTTSAGTTRPAPTKGADRDCTPDR